MTNKFEKKDLKRLAWRWMIHSQMSWSYNKMQGCGYYAAIYPCLKRIYGDDQVALAKSAKTNSNFFNSTPHMSNIIIGMTVAVEEQGGEAAISTVDGLKTGLMGPFAGIGDSIFGVIIPTIFGAIAAYMAIAGNPLGEIIWLIVGFLIVLLRVKLTEIGYQSGVKLISSYQTQINKFTNSAMILGLVVIGGLIPTIITANLNDAISIGEVTVDLQAMSNQILPGLVPILLTVLCYKLLGVKNITSTKLIFIVMGLGIVLSVLGVLI